MTPPGPWLVWMVVGAVVGCLFLVVCFVSVVKAVRDRHRIQARNKARRAAVTNGQAPGANATCLGCHKRLRPNLVIIRDTEKEQRVKHATMGCSPTTSTTLTSATPPGSPGAAEDVSGAGPVAISTVAEMAGQPTGISCISSGRDDGRADPPWLSDDPCPHGNRRGRLRSVGEVSVDVGTAAIAFRRSSVASCGAGSTGLISSFPVPLTTLVDSVPFSDHSDDNGARTHRVRRLSDEAKDKFNPRSTDIRDSLPLPHVRGTGRYLYPGFSPAIRVSSPYCSTCERELCGAVMGPRRNSYDVSSGIALDLPPRRRHSDDYRLAISSSFSRLCPNAARGGRRYRWDGAENPAYEELDDEGRL